MHGRGKEKEEKGKASRVKGMEENKIQRVGPHQVRPHQE